MEIINWDEKLLPYSSAVSELIVKFESLSQGYKSLDKQSPIERVEGRVKSISSIVDKAQRKSVKFEDIFDSIEDIGGVRIICRFIDDIASVIGLIRSRDGRDLTIVSERDYIEKVKPSGYRSYHIIVKYPVITVSGYHETTCEIQIRTMTMNFWATVEHSLRYKYKGNIPENIKKRLVTSSEAASKLDNEMNTIREDIIDAQNTVDQRIVLIDEILKNIQYLYYNSKLKQVEELNNEFYEIYETGSFDRLMEFNRQLKLLREIYK